MTNKAVALVAALGLTAAATFTATWEGESKTVYKDVIGVPTICRGHTGKDVYMGMPKATDAQCDAWHAEDVLEAYRVVQSCVKVPLTPGEKVAWTSFTLNVGPGKQGVKDGMCALKSGRTPSHVRYLNAGQPLDACAMLMQWTKAGGVEFRGLRNRRIAEVRECVKDLK